VPLLAGTDHIDDLRTFSADLRGLGFTMITEQRHHLVATAPAAPDDMLWFLGRGLPATTLRLATAPGGLRASCRAPVVRVLAVSAFTTAVTIPAFPSVRTALVVGSGLFAVLIVMQYALGSWVERRVLGAIAKRIIEPQGRRLPPVSGLFN
jgi:hypothetical protein